MTDTALYVLFAAMITVIAAGLLIWAAVIIYLRDRRARHPRSYYRPSDSTIPAARC